MIFLIITGVASEYRLQLLSKEGRARCLDGSPYGFYVQRGESPNTVIFMDSGGTCAAGPL
jgi:hypothetical protein